MTLRRVAAAAKPKRIAPSCAPSIVPNGKPVGLLALRRHHCRAPLDRYGNDNLMLFCGAPTIRGSSWCATHHRRFTQSVVVRHGSAVH